jgi:hypothetical protein
LTAAPGLIAGVFFDYYDFGTTSNGFIGLGGTTPINVKKTLKFDPGGSDGGEILITAASHASALARKRLASGSGLTRQRESRAPAPAGLFCAVGSAINQIRSGRYTGARVIVATWSRGIFDSR